MAKKNNGELIHWCAGNELFSGKRCLRAYMAQEPALPNITILEHKDAHNICGKDVFPSNEQIGSANTR